MSRNNSRDVEYITSLKKKHMVQLNNSSVNYACVDCSYMFLSDRLPESCPMCGKKNIHEADWEQSALAEVKSAQK